MAIDLTKLSQGDLLAVARVQLLDRAAPTQDRLRVSGSPRILNALVDERADAGVTLEVGIDKRLGLAHRDAQ